MHVQVFICILSFSTRFDRKGVGRAYVYLEEMCMTHLNKYWSNVKKEISAPFVMIPVDRKCTAMNYS